MLLGGDEFGRTQRGNNNSYCQDNEISWYDWDHLDHDLLEWTRHLIALRQAHPVFRRRRFFQGRPLRMTVGPDRIPDIAWFRPDGGEMTDADWSVGYAKSLAVYLNGAAIPDPDVHGGPIVDDSFFLLLNAWDQELEFTLPTRRWSPAWTVVLDTACLVGPSSESFEAGGIVKMSGRRLILLQSAEPST
jgi:glycogen operon protein